MILVRMAHKAPIRGAAGLAALARHSPIRRGRHASRLDRIEDALHALGRRLIGYPGPGEKSRGGHANVAAGYDDTLKIGNDVGALLVRNSWGTGWALAGYGWLSYKYVLQGLATDWWSLISEQWVNDGQFQ